MSIVWLRRRPGGYARPDAAGCVLAILDHDRFAEIVRHLGVNLTRNDFRCGTGRECDDDVQRSLRKRLRVNAATDAQQGDQGNTFRMPDDLLQFVERTFACRPFMESSYRPAPRNTLSATAPQAPCLRGALYPGSSRTSTHLSPGRSVT